MACCLLCETFGWAVIDFSSNMRTKRRHCISRIPSAVSPFQKAAPRYQCHARQDESSLKHMVFLFNFFVGPEKLTNEKYSIYT